MPQEPISLSNQANQAMIEAVRSEKPSSFTVGVAGDVLARRGELTLTYDRKLSNVFGLSAYLKAWWHDAAVLPQDKTGILIGAEGVYRFKPK